MLRRLMVAALAATALAGFTAGAAPGRPAAPQAIPRPDHVVVVMEENHSFGDVIGSSSAPYLNSLAAGGASFTQSFAITHPSEPNYLAIFSGSTQGLSDDSCPHIFGGANLGQEAIGAGLTFTGYSESMPSAGYTGCTSGNYARKHNPWVNFSNVPAAANQPFTKFPTDFTTLPTLSFVIPNLQNDMHDGTVQQGDTWLQSHLDAYARWAKAHNSLLVVTWDEDDNSANNQVPTIITGAGVTAGSYHETINHYNVLRTLEDAYGLPRAGASASASPITDIFAGQTGGVTLANPGNQTGTVGTAASLQISATDTASGTLSYTATGLPAGLSINSSSGLIAGTPTTAGTSTVTVTATDSTGPSGSTTFTWTVSPVAGNTVTVTNPGSQAGTVGTAASLQIHASDSASGQTLAYGASGLPAGLSINSSTGLISGTATAAGSGNVTVTATDTTNASGSTTFGWTVSPASGGCPATQLLGNPGFETGAASPWTASSGVISNASGESPHSGSWYAWLDGYGSTHTDTLAQTVTLPTGCTSYQLGFWLHIDTAETTTTTQYDKLTAQVLNSSGAVLGTLATFSNLDHNTGYAQHTYNLSAYAGQTITIKFTGAEDSSQQTSFALDDTALSVS